jgi:signal transduction histidine kinase
MINPAMPGRAQPRRWDFDPRRSLAAAAMWLIIALAITFSIAAALWVGSIARRDVFQQHVRRLSLETDQLSSELGQAIAARLGALRAARILLDGAGVATRQNGLSAVFDELQSAYPELEWLAIADTAGRVASANEALIQGSRVDSAAWFTEGMQGRPWLGIIDDRPLEARSPGQDPGDHAAFGDLAAPVRDESGQIIGVIAARLGWRRAPNHPLRLTDEADPNNAAQAFVLDRRGVVLFGPQELRGKPWWGIPVRGADAAATPHFERLPGGAQVLVSRAQLSAGGSEPPLGWQVQLCEPNQRVYQRADALALRILWVSLGLGAATALLGTLGALHLTRRLTLLTQSVAAVGRSEASRIEVPPGRDEVTALANAFAKILDDLQQERTELQSLSDELERRVAVRTREVERLAEESRYAAIVRERLKIARDLHDTLAHSMMAMLSEIRFLRKLHSRDPGAVAAELAHAEEVAHEGLKEARSAITQMRVNAVRETGLGPALSNVFDRFIDRTGLTGEFIADLEAARFGDERAETLLRMAQEALRNVERHARATRVVVTLAAAGGTRLQLTIEDNGIGFDPRAHRPDHYGIVGLREQADLIGAELEISSKRGEGTKLAVSLNLSPIPFTRPA